MKKIYKNSSTEENLDRVNLQRREMKATLSRFSPVFSRVRQPAHQSLSLSTIRTSVPEITVKLKTVTVPDMLIIHLMQNMGIRDYRGGGRSSARETIGRVAAGAIAKKNPGTIRNRPDCLYPFYWRISVFLKRNIVMKILPKICYICQIMLMQKKLPIIWNPA